MNDFSQSVDIKGFRKGSTIPTQVIVSQVGSEAVKSRAIQDLSDRALAVVTNSGEVRLIGTSKLDGGGEALALRGGGVRAFSLWLLLLSVRGRSYCRL